MGEMARIFALSLFALSPVLCPYWYIVPIRYQIMAATLIFYKGTFELYR